MLTGDPLLRLAIPPEEDGNHGYDLDRLKHAMTPKKAKEVAQKIAKDLNKRFDLGAHGLATRSISSGPAYPDAWWSARTRSCSTSISDGC
jgi:hypothetical protein